jgi:hypothetical protein
MKKRFVAVLVFWFSVIGFTNSLLATHVSGYTRKDGTHVSSYERGGSSGGGLPSWADMSDYWFWVFLIIVVVVVLMVAMTMAEGKRVSPEAIEQNKTKAARFLALMQNGTIAPINTPVLLREDETAILNETCELMEAKATRFYGGTGTRIKGIYVGGGASRSIDSLSQIDSGTLTLTNQRIVFTGSMQGRVAELKKIVSLRGFSDAIEISSGKSKSQVYMVDNPILWEGAIKLVNSGGFRAQPMEKGNSEKSFGSHFSDEQQQKIHAESIKRGLATPEIPSDDEIEKSLNSPKLHYPKIIGSNVHFECKYCGQPIEVNADAGGDEFQCPGCDKKIIVPLL